MMTDFTIIENSEAAKDNYGHACGSEDFIISGEDIKALLEGKCLAVDINAHEYVGFISMSKEE